MPLLLATAAALRAGAAEPASVEVEPPRVVLGAGVRPRLRLVGAGLAEARWTSSLGSVSAGELDLGARLAPGYAVVAVAARRAGGGELRAAAVVRLVGKGNLPTHTSPGAQVTVDIGGAVFGPVTADARGDAAVVVEVPPEIDSATVLARDHRGLSTVRVIDLPGAPHPRGVLLAPEHLGAGERGLITVFAVERDGSWRDASAAPPELSAGAGLRLAGPAVAVAPGRWDAPVVGERLPSPATARVAASIDGEPIEPASVSVAAAPRATVGWLLGARAGVATAFRSSASMAALAELLVTRDDLLAAGLEVGVARGGGALTQTMAAVAARLRLPVAPRLRLELAAGAGAATGSTARGRDLAPLVFAAAGAAARLGPGELAVELRWTALRYDDFALGIDGNPLGAVLTAGYRARL